MMARNLRSEFLRQLQGIDSYTSDRKNILFMVAATNKPWDIDSAFLRPGRFGVRIYCDLPDAPAREYIINHKLEKIKKLKIVSVAEDIDVMHIVKETKGYNAADINQLLDMVQDAAAKRSIQQGQKYINMNDFLDKLATISPSVQKDDIVKLLAWQKENM
jgi:transitional endoplasmic reticulum ATPase